MLFSGEKWILESWVWSTKDFSRFHEKLICCGWWHVKFDGCKFGYLLINLFHFPFLFSCVSPDSEEEIFVRKKAKNQKVLQDSESEEEEEDGGSPVQKDALGGDKENGEEKENIATEKKKSHRVRPALLDTDDSDTGDLLQIENLETGGTSGLPEGELEKERSLKSGKKYRKHKHKLSIEEEPAKQAVAKPRRRKGKIMESLKQLRKEKKPVAEVGVLAQTFR